MPFAVTAVWMFVLLALTSSSEASTSCLTRSQARQHFGSLHLYLHRNRCWDALATRKAAQNNKFQREWIDRWENIDATKYPALARSIETVQLTSPIVERKVEQMFTPGSVVLAAIAIVLTLGTIEVLFRCTIS